MLCEFSSTPQLQPWSDTLKCTWRGQSYGDDVRLPTGQSLKKLMDRYRKMLLNSETVRISGSKAKQMREGWVIKPTNLLSPSSYQTLRAVRFTRSMSFDHGHKVTNVET